ncbi:hypothetical protein OAS39_00175 [Pirellulales bacterium]|nr:hypothetical protein [Pirellulales bacterium]
MGPRIGIIAVLFLFAWGEPAKPALGELADPSEEVGAVRLDGCLLLRNGRVLSGQVIREGAYYRIEQVQGEIMVPAAQTIRFCRTLDEAYQTLRSSTQSDSAAAHVQLAKWCLQQQLLPQAARELLNARTLDPTCRGLEAAERQLRQQMEMAEQRIAPVSLAPVEDVREAGQGVVVVVAAPIAKPQAVGPGGRATFVRSIQPMLVNSCLVGGCHSAPGHRSFQMNRLAIAGGGHADLIRQNLAAVASQLDSSDPESSPLLQYARLRHGQAGRKQSQAVDPRQAELLIAWAYQATGKTPALVAADESERDVNDETAKAPDATMPAAAATDDSAAPREVEEAQPQPFAPRDRFDPQIFNRANAGRGIDAA